MIIEATITSKGQLTVPKEVRERLHLKSGSKVQFIDESHGVLLRPKSTKTLREWQEHIQKKKPNYNEIKKIFEEAREQFSKY